MLVREETLQGQLIALEAQYLDIDSLKKGAFWNVLYQLESLASELLGFVVPSAIFDYLIMYYSAKYMYE